MRRIGLVVAAFFLLAGGGGGRAGLVLEVKLTYSRPAEAGILATYTTNNTGESAVGIVLGESATTTTGGTFDHIAFNFFTGLTAPTPTAAGHLLILTHEYLGSPSGLVSFFAIGWRSPRADRAS